MVEFKTNILETQPGPGLKISADHLRVLSKGAGKQALEENKDIVNLSSGHGVHSQLVSAINLFNEKEAGPPAMPAKKPPLSASKARARATAARIITHRLAKTVVKSAKDSPSGAGVVGGSQKLKVEDVPLPQAEKLTPTGRDDQTTATVLYTAAEEEKKQEKAPSEPLPLEVRNSTDKPAPDERPSVENKTTGNETKPLKAAVMDELLSPRKKKKLAGDDVVNTALNVAASGALMVSSGALMDALRKADTASLKKANPGAGPVGAKTPAPSLPVGNQTYSNNTDVVDTLRNVTTSATRQQAETEQQLAETGKGIGDKADAGQDGGDRPGIVPRAANLAPWCSPSEGAEFTFGNPVAVPLMMAQNGACNLVDMARVLAFPAGSNLHLQSALRELSRPEDKTRGMDRKTEGEGQEATR